MNVILRKDFKFKGQPQSYTVARRKLESVVFVNVLMIQGTSTCVVMSDYRGSIDNTSTPISLLLSS